MTDAYPKILSDLYDPLKENSLNYLELCNLGNSLDINISPQQQSNVEKLTEAQANSKNWFDYRSGRITASNAFSVVHTHDDMPSRSLIMSICCPESYKYKTPAISWGCSHEEQAYNSDKNIMIQHSPDELVSSCCGKGCVEIKCPFNQRDNYISETVENDNFYLTKMNNSIKLSVTHQYYYQLQTEIHVNKSNFCDFFV